MKISIKKNRMITIKYILLVFCLMHGATTTIIADQPQTNDRALTPDSVIPFSHILPQNAAIDNTHPALSVQTPSTTLPHAAEHSKQPEKKATENNDDSLIYLNFDNTSLSSIVSYLGEQKKINIVPLKDLDNIKISLSTRKPLTLDRAWDVLLTVLEMNGFSLIKSNNLYRIVTNQNNGTEVLPFFSSSTGTDPESLPDSDMVIRYMYEFKNLKLDIAKSILTKMIDEKNIQGNADLNICIIKDQCLNIKAAFKIIKELDLSGLRESIEIIHLENANADNVKKIFDDIMGTDQESSNSRTLKFSSNQKENVYFSTSTKIIPEPINNNLILLGTKKNIDRIKDFIYKYIDKPIDQAASRLHIKELRFVRAQDIKPIIDDIIRPPKGSSEKALVLEGGYKVFEDVLTSAETDDDAAASGSKRGVGNRLIVACNTDDWKRLESFIDKLDKPQPQVAIEVMIIDITLEQTKELGAQIFNAFGKQPAKNTNMYFTNIVGGTLEAKADNNSDGIAQPNKPLLSIAAPSEGQADNSPSIITLGDSATQNIWGLLRAVLNQTNAQIISQPYIVANNNQSCNVTTKKTKRVAGKLETGKSLTPVQKQEDLSAAISTTITPHINLAGIIDLDIDMTIDEFEENSNADQAPKSNRHIVTKSSMFTGEVLVLGGLTKSDLKENVDRTPILSSIPILGSLFKSKKKKKTESNLYVFIRPSIIKPRFEGNPDEYTQLKLDYAKYQVMKGDTYVADRDPIQRWFFKPTNQSIKNKVADAARGILRPIDDYIYGRTRPKTVDIKQDPYFSVSEAIAKEKERRKQVIEKSKESPAEQSTVQLPPLEMPMQS